jgi:hypothetical protein
MENALEQRFNDDLLVREEDRHLAAKLYPTVLHVLDHPELRNCFAHYDEPANHAKRRSKALGTAAIILASLALLCASGEIVFHTKPRALLLIALAGVIFGVSSVSLGSVGLLSGRAKREWLHQRLMAERVRQFHFQSFVSLLPQIIASLHNSAAKLQFASLRRQKFEAFRAGLQGHLEAALTRVLATAEEPELWFERPPATLPIAKDEPALGPLFDAYRRLRIEHQLSYADFRMRDDLKIFSSAARRQASVLESVGFSCIILLLSIHIAVAAAILIGWVADASPAQALIPVLNAAIIWIAVAALAARAFEQGLQPERELERYQQYGLGCKAILERFDSAASQAEKVKIMMEMERLSFDEMRNFLITNNRARFVM